MTASTDPPTSERIELRLDDVRQLFHTMDPTPFPGRDLDTDAEAFVVGWARQLHGHGPITILVHLPAPAPGDQVLIASAIHNHFQSSANHAERRFRELLALGRRSLAVGLAFLGACLGIANWLAQIEPGPAIVSILREGFVIAGWVALWRPLEIFLYDWWPIRAERRILMRLAQATVEVRGSGT